MANVEKLVAELEGITGPVCFRLLAAHLVDSSGLAVFAKLDRNGGATLQHVNGHLLRVLEVVGLDRLVTSIHDSVHRPSHGHGLQPAGPRYASAVIDPKPAGQGGRPGSRSGWRRTVADVLIGTAVALVVSMPFLVDPSGTSRYRPGAVLLGVVVVVAAWRGVRAGIATAAISTFVVWYSFTQPRSSWTIEHWEDVFAIAVYALTATLVLVLVARLADARRRERFQRSLVDTLVDEAPVGIATSTQTSAAAHEPVPGARLPGPTLEDRAAMREVLATSEASPTARSRSSPRDGQRERPLAVSYYPVREDDRSTGIGAVVVDATDDS
jgi:hypothetical protein